jgi:hypothetical protein
LDFASNLQYKNDAALNLSPAAQHCRHHLTIILGHSWRTWSHSIVLKAEATLSRGVVHSEYIVTEDRSKLMVKTEEFEQEKLMMLSVEKSPSPVQFKILGLLYLGCRKLSLS